MKRVAFACLACLLCAACGALFGDGGSGYAIAMGRADRARVAGRTREAVAAWRDAALHATRLADRAEAELRAARGETALGEVDAALALYARIAAYAPPVDPHGTALVEAARIEEARGDHAAALALDLRATRETPDDVAASRALADALHVRDARGDAASETLTFLDALYREVGDHDVGDDVLVALADRALAAGDAARSRHALERCIAEHPYPTGARVDDAYVRLADLDHAAGDAATEASHLEALARLHDTSGWPGTYTRPRMPGALIRLARLYRDALHDAAKAVATYERFRAEYPRHVLLDDAIYEEAGVVLAEGDHARGCALLAQAAGSHGGHATRLARAQLAVDCAAP